MPKNILLVDDHEIVRIGLRQILQGTGLEILREATKSKDAIELLNELDFDLVVVDPKLPEGSGFSHDQGNETHAAQPRHGDFFGIRKQSDDLPFNIPRNEWIRLKASRSRCHC